ncbi:MAG TPA: SDR family oxidoreductase [Anaerolineae bacterium]
MRLLLTGGSGYLGTGILKRAPRTWEISATYLTQTPSSEHAAAFRLDLRDAGAVHRLVSELGPDVIIHTAALMHGDAMLSTNVDGSRHIARAAARAHARLIHLSSDVVFDGEHAPYTEESPPDPISAYGRSKALAEDAVRSEYANPVIVRTSLIYSLHPLDPRTAQALNGEMPRLFTDEYRCPILCDDLVDALIELATLDYTGVLNVAGSQRLSRYEFGLKLARALRIEPQFSPALSQPVTVLRAGQPVPDRRPRDCTLDTSRAQKLLRTHLRGVDSALETLSP